MAAAAWIALLGIAAIGCDCSIARAATPLPSAAGPSPPQAADDRGAVSAQDAPIEGRVDPDTYRVGPGDEFALRYSDLLDPKILRVAPSGELLLPDAGPVTVAGLTLREAQSRVREILRPYVRGKGFVLALHRPRRFRLPVLGDVERPGVVTLQAPVRASEAIEAAGGVAPTGAKRGIEVRRGTDTLRVDLVRYARAADLSANPLVFETDVIYVPAADWSLEVQGAVPHPGQFDFVAGDRLSTLVELGGGLRPEASAEEASLVRFRPDGSRETVPVRVGSAVLAPGGSEDLPLANGDRLFIPARSHWHEAAVAWVQGEVVRPGPYPIEEGADHVRALIERAGGYTPFADRMAVRVERLIEQEPDTAFLNLARDKEQFLSSADRSYVLMRTRERNALSAPLGALLEAGDARGDIALRRDDRIVVPTRVAFVSVQGEVRAPGLVPYEKGRGFDHYVRAAGDYTSRAYKSRARVTLAATGRQVGPDETGELMPGDIIWVPTEPERNVWATVRDVFGVTAALTAVVISVVALTK
jgi:polysaccharide biosynthesis/export protein